MKKTLLLAALLLLALPAAGARAGASSGDTDREAVRLAVLDYVEGIYNVEPARIERSVHPKLAKLGFYRGKNGRGLRPAPGHAFERLLELPGITTRRASCRKTRRKKLSSFDVSRPDGDGEARRRVGIGTCTSQIRRQVDDRQRALAEPAEDERAVKSRRRAARGAGS